MFKLLIYFNIAFLAFLAGNGAMADTVKNTDPSKNELVVDIKNNFVSEGNQYSAGKYSTFFVEGVDETNHKKTIRFIDVKHLYCETETTPCEIKLANNRVFYEFDTAVVSDINYREKIKFDHGVLVVPFKFRTKDQTLTGQSTLGYYAGIRSASFWGAGTFFASAGLSQVDMPVTATTTETKTGLSISGGYIFESRDGFQIAFVVGSDRLGGAAGKTWDYEKDIWVSVGLGFNLAK